VQPPKHPALGSPEPRATLEPPKSVCAALVEGQRLAADVVEAAGRAKSEVAQFTKYAVTHAEKRVFDRASSRLLVPSTHNTSTITKQKKLKIANVAPKEG
jgi:hypothetical protein